VTVTLEGTTQPTYRSAGADIVFVTNAVTTTVSSVIADGTGVVTNVFLYATDTGGFLPVNDTVTIVNSGTTATVTNTAHGLATNDKVWINGASHLANNGVFTVTVTGVNTYTYTMGSAPGSNPTGTITSTFVVLYGTTSGAGTISMTRSFSTDVDVEGWARASSAPPYYKTGAITGIVDSATGTAFTAVMIPDE